MWIPVGLLGVMVAVAVAFALPQIALFDNKLTTIVRNGFNMAILNLLPAVAIIAIDLFPYALILFAPRLFFMSLPFWIVCGVSLGAYINSYLLLKIFRKYGYK